MIAAACHNANLLVRGVAMLCGGSILVVGVWALLAPASFSGWIDFPPYNEHLLHDAGAFQVGIGVSVLTALVWSDAVAVTLLGFLVAGTIHAVNHGVDLHLGGHPSDQWLLGALDLLALVALGVHLRHRRLPGRPSERRA